MTKKNKGITLIALVITIIVLLILAAVSIATLTGENGILTKATEALEKTDEAAAKEEVKLAVLESMSDTGKFDANKFIEKIKSKGWSTEVTEDGIVVKKGSYEGKVDKTTGEIIEFTNQGTTEGTGPQPQPPIPGDETLLARDALKEGDYIIYPAGNGKKIPCRVLYDANSEYGIQLISADVEESVTLIETDVLFQYEGTIDVDDVFKQDVAAYNKAVEKLNTAAEKYINTAYTNSGEARCVGSKPKFSEKNIIGDMYNPVDEDERSIVEQFGLIGKIPGDNTKNSEEDIKQLKKLNAMKTGNGLAYCVGSNQIILDRVDANIMRVLFDVGNVNNSEGISKGDTNMFLCYSNKNKR